MKKLLLSILFVIGMMTVNAQQFTSGNGTQSNPFVITTPAQLDNVRNYRNSHFVLAANIDLSSYISSTYPINGWEPIGTENAPFIGSLDGRCHKIEGLWINRPNEDNVGLFGVMNDAKVKRIGIIGSTYKPIIGNNNVGILTGTYQKAPPASSSVDIEECFVLSYDIQGKNNVGGLIGIANCVYVSFSSSRVFIMGGHKVGGLIGDAKRLYADYCYTQGVVYTFENDCAYMQGCCTNELGCWGFAGGFAGGLDQLGTRLKNCYTACKMLNWSLYESTERIGAIFGYGSYDDYDGHGEHLPIWDYELSGEHPIAETRNIICSGTANGYICGGGAHTTYEMKNLDFLRHLGFEFQYVIPNLNTLVNMISGYSPMNNCVPPNLPYIWSIVQNYSYPFLFNEMAYGSEIIDFQDIMESYINSFSLTKEGGMNINSNNSLIIKQQDASLTNSFVYPNPTSNIIIIETDIKSPNIQVFDESGNMIINTTEKIINLSPYKTGIYIFNINGEIRKVIKK